MNLSILFLLTIVIYTIVTIRIVKRGQILGNRDLASVIFIGVIGAIVVLIQDLEITYRAIIGGFIIAGSVIFWYFVREKTVNVVRAPFPLVSLHYPMSIVTDDNYYKLVPEYVTNNRTWQAYSVSKELLGLCVRSRAVKSWVSYPNSQVMKKQLEQYTINKKDATLKDLDTILKRDNQTLMFIANPIPDSKISDLIQLGNEGAFKDFELVFIHSMHIITKNQKSKDYPTTRRILIDNTKRTARPLPNGDLWLWQAGIFKVSECRKLFPCTIGVWCMFYGLKHHFPRTIHYRRKERYEVSELLGQDKQVTTKPLI